MNNRAKVIAYMARVNGRITARRARLGLTPPHIHAAAPQWLLDIADARDNP